MNTLSIPVGIMASISFYVGLYHLLIYGRRRQHREDLTFGLLCLATSLYDVFCIGLYNSLTVAEGVQWQRAQFIALALFTPAFMWFVSDYTHQKPGIVLYAFSAFFLLAIIIQLVDRSDLTWMVDSPSIKEVLLPLGLKITYYEATFGPFTTVQSLTGLAASTYIVVNGVRFYRRGYRREAGPLLLAMGFVYAAALNDTGVSNGLYQFVYTIEYGYMAMILLMAYSLSNEVVQAAVMASALRESESIFRSFVEQTSEGIVLLDEHGSVVEWNHAVELVTGIRREEVLGKPGWEFQFRLLPDERKSPAAYERLKSSYLDILRSGISPWQDRSLEAVFQRADGSKRIVEQRLFPIKTSKGFSIGGVSRDITDRKRAEETLQMFQYTIDRASDAVQWLNREAGFEYVNDQACRSLGYTREELLHLHLWDIDPVYPKERWDKNWESYQDGRLGGSENVETLHRRKDGSVFPVDVSSNHLWFGDRELHVAVVRDITERRQVEAQIERTLRETRVRFEVSQALAGAETEDEVLDVLIQHAGFYPQAHVAILTIDRTGSELAAILRRHDTFESGLIDPTPVGMRFPASSFPSIRLFHPDQPFVSNDLLADERMDSATRELFRPGGANSQADFPLTAGNEWMGYIGVTGKPAGYFDEEKQHLYQTLAEQGAVALRAARLRETIRESQQRLSLLVQQSPLAVIEWNTEFHVVSWNPAAEQIFGYTGEEALGRHPAGFIVPEETVSQVEPTWHNLLTHTGSAHVTHDHLTKDGRRITCEWFSAPLVGVDGQIIGVASLVQDITERRQAEEALKDKTAELDRYFTNALDLFCIADTDGYFRRLNKEWESTLGYSIQELEGTRFLDYIHPDDMEATLTAISRLGEQKEVLNFVNRYRSKDGSYRWIEWRSSAVGKTIYAAARDITERKRAEEALRESEEKYRRLVELSPVAMWINKGGIITYMNPAALRILGATDLQQVVGRAVLDFIHPDYHVIVKERSSQTMDHAQIVPLLEEKYVRLDGSVVEVEVTATPFMTAGGRAVQVLFQDITERKRAEEALRKSEERFRALVETTSDWIWEVDGNGVYTYSSPKVKDTLGYEPHEVVGRTPFDFMLPNEAARIAASFKQIMDQKLPIANLENTCLHKNGRAVVLETSGVPILNRMGQLIGYRGIDRDITDRKQAEEALRQANLVVESSPAMLFRWKAAKGRPVILVSQNVTQLGYTAEEFLNGLTNFASIMHPDDLERVDREVQSYSANGIDRFQQEYRIITKDGQVRWIDDRTVAERNADGQVTRYQGIVVDITHRKLVEEALRQSRNLLQAVLDTIPARVFWKDCDLRYLGCNRSFALDAGVNSLDDVIGKDDYQLAWREQASLYRSDDRQVLESGKPKIDYEEPQTTLDGRCIWLRTSKVPLRDTKGAVWGVLGTYEDITTRKQVEEALKESEEKFRSIVENALAGIFMIDDAYQFVYTNDELCRILRYSREELLGLDFREVLVDDSRALVADWYVRRWRGGRFPPRYELDVVRRDGEVRHIEMSVVVVNDAAGRPRSIGQLVDITERKQAERERESLIAELERKNAELERFTYTVSHDLKSPLITIKGFLGYLEKAALSGNIDQLRSDIARIGEAAKKMERLLSELLELSRIGRIINPPEAVPFEAIAREAVELVRGQLAARQVTMTIAESLPIVYGDRARLVEVMQNLVDNAVKFMSDQAQPRIEIGVRVAAPGSPPVFYVRDNGLGVEPQYHQRIFVLFDKLDVRSEGTGVGLTLVKRIIEVHGGRIWVESEGLGKGCTFCFTLADEPAATSPASESHPAISSLGK